MVLKCFGEGGIKWHLLEKYAPLKALKRSIYKILALSPLEENLDLLESVVLLAQFLVVADFK